VQRPPDLRHQGRTNRSITYHVLDTSTPFLFSLYDADRLKAYFNNVSDTIVQGHTTIPVVRKWGHPFFNTSRTEAGVFLTVRFISRVIGSRLSQVYKVRKDPFWCSRCRTKLGGNARVCDACEGYGLCWRCLPLVTRNCEHVVDHPFVSIDVDI
jgi:hypothetical protein